MKEFNEADAERIYSVEPHASFISLKTKRVILCSHRGHSVCERFIFTLAFVIDLPSGNDFIEDSSEGLVLSYDSRWDEWRHDELPLTDVSFHGYPERGGLGCEREKSAANMADR